MRARVAVVGWLLACTVTMAGPVTVKDAGGNVTLNNGLIEVVVSPKGGMYV